MTQFTAFNMQSILFLTPLWQLILFFYSYFNRRDEWHDMVSSVCIAGKCAYTEKLSNAFALKSAYNLCRYRQDNENLNGGAELIILDLHVERDFPTSGDGWNVCLYHHRMYK